MPSIPAWGTPAAGKPIAPMTIHRREPGPRDVLLDILFCGVCHSDLHQARDEWTNALFPMVPGHEIVGRAAALGREVKGFKLGEVAGIGCVVDSCHVCGPCREHLEQFCEKGPAFTYNGTEMDRVTPTYGGYSTRVVVDERFALHIPAGLDPAGAAPLLCAGITTYSPLKRFSIGPGSQVGVVGLGGLGHMAVKLAASLGAEVTLLSTTASKEADARRLGAKAFANTRDAKTFEKLAGKFDLLLDTISAPHDYNQHLALVKVQGTMVVVGVPPEPTALDAHSLIGGNRALVGSMIGGIAETQAMLDHCAKHGIVSDIEIIPIQQINQAYERMLRSDVRYRFVIDLASLRN